MHFDGVASRPCFVVRFPIYLHQEKQSNYLFCLSYLIVVLIVRLTGVDVALNVQNICYV